MSKATICGWGVAVKVMAVNEVNVVAVMSIIMMMLGEIADDVFTLRLSIHS